MAPRKRTSPESPAPSAEKLPKAEPKPKAAKAAPKKAAKVAAQEPAPKKPAATAAKKAEPEAPPMEAVVPPVPKKVGRKAAAVPAEGVAPTPQPAQPLFTAHAQKVVESIQAGRAIELIFQDAEANPPRTFEARQLIFDGLTGSWFIWGWDRRYNAERHHRLDLLAEINPVEGPGRAAQGPFPEGTPANQIGGWRGGEPIPVKAVLQKQWVFAVKQAPASFPEFRIEDLEDGKAQVTFSGTDLRAIARWCMQFGDGIQVQEPMRLVDRIKQVGIAWAGKAPAPALPAPKPTPKPEPRPEPRPESKAEPRRAEAPRKENREPRETDAPKAKPGRVEVRFERL